MAGFRAHVYGGLLAGVSGAVVCSHVGLIEPGQVVQFAMYGAFGSMLPDIDSDHSASLQFVFALVSVGVVAAIEVNQAWRCAAEYLPSVPPLIVHAAVTLGAILFLHNAALPAFKRWTVHRGILHSWLALVVFYLITAQFTGRILGYSAHDARMAGAFVTGGAIAHLLMDEIWAIRISRQDMRVRFLKSFGTAFKPLGYSRMNNLIFTSLAVWLAYLEYYQHG